MNTLTSVILSALQDTRDGGLTVEERAEAIAAAVRAETPESGALSQWIASLRVGDTLTVDDIHRFVRVELALRNAEKHHQQARAMTAERDEWRDAAKWSEGQHQHWKTVAEAATAQRDEARRLHMVVRNELGTLRAKLDAAVKTIPSDDAERFICLAHPHNHRWEEALCSAKYQLDAAVRELEETRKREALSDAIVDECDSDITKLVQERASLRAERDAIKANYDESVRECANVMAMRENVSSQLWDCMNEREGYRARLAACERVVEAATEWLGAVGDDHTRAEARLASVTYDYNRAAVAAETQATPHAGGTDA